LPNNISDLYIEEKLKKTEIAGRIVACMATIHAAIVSQNWQKQLLWIFIKK
jgi:hypothetical protein